MYVCMCVYRQIDRQTDRQTDRHTDIHTYHKSIRDLRASDVIS